MDSSRSRRVTKHLRKTSFATFGAPRCSRPEFMDDKSQPSGFKKGLTSYGDTGFSSFLRKAFIKGGGYSDDALSRPVIGIQNTASSYNPCHGNSTELIAAV